MLISRDLIDELGYEPYKEVLRCAEREGDIIDFWVAFSEVIITEDSLKREIWSRYRWGVDPGTGRDG